MNDSQNKDEQLTLELLGAIEQQSDVSQRHLAAKLGIALGLTNSYLKRCAKKGYVKIKEVPANRYLYFLTPKGFAEKSRLTAQFLSTSLTFYRQAAESCSDIFSVCERNHWPRVVLCGVSDLTEIACTRSAGHRVTIVGICDPARDAGDLLSVAVCSVWEELPNADAYVITDLENPLGMYGMAVRYSGGSERVLVPKILGLEAAIKTQLF